MTKTNIAKIADSATHVCAKCITQVSLHPACQRAGKCACGGYLRKIIAYRGYILIKQGQGDWYAYAGKVAVYEAMTRGEFAPVIDRALDTGVAAAHIAEQMLAYPQNTAQLTKREKAQALAVAKSS